MNKGYNEEEKVDLVGKMIAKSLKKDFEVSEHIEKRLALARENAMSQFRHEPVKSFDILQSIKDFFSMRMIAATGMAMLALGAISTTLITNYDDGLLSNEDATYVSKYSGAADSIELEMDDDTILPPEERERNQHE